MKKITIALIFLGMLTIAPQMVLAETKLQVSWPSTPMGTPLTDQSNLTNLIAYLYEWLVALGGLAAFIALVIAGFQYLTSVGDPGKMKDAMSRLKSALLGLGLLFGSWLILNTINPQLTILKMPSFEAPPPDFSPEIEDAAKDMIPCDGVKIFSAANFNGLLDKVEAGQCKPESGTAEINSIKIIGSCVVEFYSNTCENKDLIHVVSFLATPKKGTTTDEEYFDLTKDIPYQETTVRRVKVKEIKF